MTIKQQLSHIARQAGVSIARVTEEHAERSAIREYLGGMPRAQAEEAALGDTCNVLGVSIQSEPG